MSALKMNLGYKCSTMELSTVFVDQYIADCLPVYPLIYIWSLRRLMEGEPAAIAEICQKFQLTEGDVDRAWKHWEKMKLVSIQKGKDGMSITFLPVPERSFKHSPEHTIESPAKANLELLSKPLQEPTEPTKPHINERPRYTPMELSFYREKSRDVERLFARAENTLGKLLSYNDMNTIFGFHDWLRLPIDVIEYLLSYCADNDHRNLRYIEKCAMDWADHDIFDLEKALLYVQNFDRNYRRILQYMGVTGYPTPSHKKYMDKWLNQWQMSLEMISEACDRSVAQINKPKFNYVNKILSEWHKNSITTPEAIEAAEEEHIREERSAGTVIPISSKPKPNRFVNFEQRKNDYAHYEKLERAYLDQLLMVSE